jgi:molecular chaperone DnaK
MAISLERFLQNLTDSGLMAEEELLALRESLAFGEDGPSVESIARLLIKRGKINQYQAKRIATGKTRALVLGKNVIVGKIGEGGMGEVFLAEHRRMKRPVVIKVLPESATESEYARRRFQREVEAAAKLSHPNIVTAYDADEENGIHFLVMEYVDGPDLATLVSENGLFSIQQTVDCILQAARGLEYAHGQGIIHRDIKPDNLLLDKSGTIKILDMGLARIDRLSQGQVAHETNLTSDNQIVGTVDYMSPEQAEDSSKVDRRSDIYGLGCTMFRLLTGRPPYEGTTAFQTLIFHRVNPIPSLLDFRADVPENLDEIFRKMVAKELDDRYDSMTDVIHEFEHCLDDLHIETGTPGLLSPLEKATAPTRILEKGSAALKSDTTPSSSELTLDTGERDASSSVLDDPFTNSTDQEPLPYPAVGIDLGTTNTAVAYLDDLRRPQTITNAEGDKMTPSVILLEGDEVVVGKEAVKAMATEMEFIAQCAKRDLGERFYRKTLGGKQIPPEVLQAWVLNKIREDTQQVIGPFQKAVITVPAYFDESRRKATQDAGYIAGFEVLDIINEPTAAAVAYGFYQGHLAKQTGINLLGKDGERAKVLVYDLGGGTFDVTMMEIGGGHFGTLATDGDVELGGYDWDARLVDHVCEQFVAKFDNDPREDVNAFGRLWRECEDAKHTLSARQKTSVSCDYKGNSLRVEVTRKQFEEMTADLLNRTAFTVEETLKAASLTWQNIDRILLVGGSTRMPAVGKLLKKLSGKEPDRSVSPDEAIAQGAALQASFKIEQLQGRLPAFDIRNVNSHSLGVIGKDLKTGRKQTGVLIPRNTTLPAEAKRTLYTSKDGQGSIRVGVVEGESRNPDECALVGTCNVKDLPPDLPAKTPVRIRFKYEENGRLTVSVRVGAKGHYVDHQLVRESRMTQEQLDWWRERISGLSPVTNIVS